MSYLACRNCQHCWESSKSDALCDWLCDWCGADKPTVLEESTPLEKMIRNILKAGKRRHDDKKRLD